MTVTTMPVTNEHIARAALAYIRYGGQLPVDGELAELEGRSYVVLRQEGTAVAVYRVLPWGDDRIRRLWRWPAGLVS